MSNNKKNNKNRYHDTAKRNPNQKQNRAENSGDKYFTGKGLMDADKCTSNDISWYNKDTIQFNQTTQVPFAKIAGAEYDVGSVGTPASGITVSDTKTAFPSVMRINYVPGIGVASTYNDAPNRAFAAMYSAMQSKTSSGLKYPAYALAMLCTAVQSVAQNLAFCKRALEVANLYNSKNWTFPRLMLEAMGLDPDSVIKDREHVSVALNNLINRFNRLKCPHYIDLYKRHYSLARNIWADSTSPKAQFYIFVPECYYVYSDLGRIVDGEYDGKACCLAASYPSAPTGLSIEAWFEIIDAQINAIMNSTDFATVNGDLQRAFPDSQFVVIDLTTPNDTRPFYHDDYMSYQIHNMNWVGSVNYESTPGELTDLGLPIGTNLLADCHILGDPVKNLLIYQPKLLVSDPANAKVYPYVGESNRIVNFMDVKETLSPDYIMEATRLCAYWIYKDSKLEAVSIGTEFVTGVYIYTNFNGAAEMYSVPSAVGTTALSATQTKGLSMVSKFHKGPRVYMFQMVNASEVKFCGFIGDICEWTTLDNDALVQLNDTALLSIFSTEAPIAIK